jgi:hypothetical protein
MSLFDEVERADTSSANYLEPHYAYLNRSGRPHFKEVRDRIDTEFDAYEQNCPDEAERLRSELCSLDNQVFLSAYTELYTFTILQENGYEIECHPTIAGVTTHPEFLVSSGGEEKFYIECRALIGSPVAVRDKKLENEILDAINQVNSPDFLISLEIKKIDNENPPRSGRMRDFLQRIVDGLNYDSVYRDIETDDTSPTVIWSSNDWEIEFTISPVTEEARARRTSGSGVVGSYRVGVKWINLHEQIQRGIERKATKYGELPLPYLIILNVIHNSNFFDNNTMMSALFGEKQLTVTSFVDGTHSEKWHRSLKGAFVTPSGPKNTRVSGVFALESAFPWQEGKNSKIWLHPHATRGFDTAWIRKPYMIHNPENDKMEECLPEEFED